MNKEKLKVRLDKHPRGLTKGNYYIINIKEALYFESKKEALDFCKKYNLEIIN